MQKEIKEYSKMLVEYDNFNEHTLEDSKICKVKREVLKVLLHKS